MKTTKKNLICLLLLLLVTIYILFKVAFSSAKSMDFEISTTWDSVEVSHQPVRLSLESRSGNDLVVHVQAPFFDDPPNPGGNVGKPFPQLWDYEVVEAFFLNDSGSYLEVELCPYGQHLVLMLQGVRNIVKEKLDIHFTSVIDKDTWTGDAVIPANYLPDRVSKFNAYAIHGSGKQRIYESMYPVPAGKFENPDFHRLEYFKPLDMKSLLPLNWNPDYHSEEWKRITDKKVS